MEQLEDVKMHDAMRVSMHVEAQRVPGGFIYWKIMDRISTNTDGVAVSGVFVPFTKFRIKDEEYF